MDNGNLGGSIDDSLTAWRRHGDAEVNSW